jgi:hypothetical protein
MHTQRVEASALAVLALCSCGWRELADDRLDGRDRIHQHVLAVHPAQQDNSRRALNQLRQRKDTA